LVNHGGILIDPDMIFLRLINPYLYDHVFVIGIDFMKHDPFPELLNIGIALGKPGSQFARLWLESLKDYHDELWIWNSGMVPYKIW
jgi:hypothetical protein